MKMHLVKKRRLAFLDLFLAGQRSGLTDKDITDEAHTFMFAIEKTKIKIENIFRGMIPHLQLSLPQFITYRNIEIFGNVRFYSNELQNKIHEEICRIFCAENNYLTLTELNSTQYLDMVIKEVLRLTPPVVTYNRKLEKDLHLSKYILPAGTAVPIFSYMLHRDEDILPDPEKYDPERFSAENAKSVL